MVLTQWHVLLLVPLPALAVFVLLGLGPTRLSRRVVLGLAILGGVGPLAAMAGVAALCLAGTCRGVAPIFTLEVGEADVALALALDPLGALVALTVTVIGACVLLYSVAYMGRAKMADLRRFFALMTLFLAAMLTMVLAGDSIVFFLGWELMGLCSFFLIAFHVTSAQAIAAGRKAFVITRVADAFLLAALLILFLEAASVRLDLLIPAGVAMDDAKRILIAALLLAGALGKSAQVPFHTWLPSAMAGPTPVSALLHSATMVAAGAFLLIRFSPMLEATPSVQAATMAFGALTAFFGAVSAVVQTDVKRLLAWSSISQIGLMIFAIGVGAPEAAAAHFVVHALFKSLLFLSAGDIVHAAGHGTEMSAMRGAWRRRPVAYLCFVAGAASLAGLPVVTAGWWSKEAILAAAYGWGDFGVVLWAVALISAALTGVYAFRPVLVGLAPGDRPRPSFGGAFTLGPILFLAAGALTAGALVEPIILFLGGETPHLPALPEGLGAAAPFLGLLGAAALTWLPGPAIRLEGARKLRRGARVDGVYQALFVRPFVELVRRLSGLRGGVEDPVGAAPVRLGVWLQGLATDRGAGDPFDRGWMGLAGGLVGVWTRARRSQTGRARDQALGLAVGAVVLILLAWGTTWR